MLLPRERSRAVCSFKVAIVRSLNCPAYGSDYDAPTPSDIGLQHEVVIALSFGYGSTVDWCSVNEREDGHAPAIGG